jgi:outer membrane protein OmpU
MLRNEKDKKENAMKKALFATTAAAALAAGGMAAAQDITLFGDARLGLGYQVSNDGDLVLDEDELRAISRVRFGVRMTGETPTGITFGATIRADNAIDGEGNTADPDNQTAGSVFVSGTYGTLTFGDINEAHQQHVGDLAEIGLTGLTFINELPYLGNRVGGGEYRPTVRYDYDIAGFGLSASTGTELDSIGVGASYALDFGGGALTFGAGYFDGESSSLGFEDDTLDDLDLSIDGEQIAAGIRGEFGGFSGQVIYVTTDAELVNEDVDPEEETDFDGDFLGFGLGTAFGAFGVNAIYVHALDAPGDLDGEDAYGVDFTYDLGGGAELKGGVARTLRGIYSAGLADDAGENETVADFGISMAF